MGHTWVLVHRRPGAVGPSSANIIVICTVLQSPEFGSLLLVTPGKLHELSFAVLLILEIPG